MSYHIYQTGGFVLGGVGVGEDSRLIRFFTREHGVIWAKAQGVRKITSKNRAHLQRFSYGAFSFVRGKTGWRVVRGEQKYNIFTAFGASEKGDTIAKLFALISRLSPEAESSPKLFDEFEKGIAFFMNEDLNKEEQKSFETLLAVKTLYHLGYWDHESDIDGIYLKPVTHDTLTGLAPIRRKTNAKTHEAIEGSHL